MLYVQTDMRTQCYDIVIIVIIEHRTLLTHCYYNIVIGSCDYRTRRILCFREFQLFTTLRYWTRAQNQYSRAAELRSEPKIISIRRVRHINISTVVALMTLKMHSLFTRRAQRNSQTSFSYRNLIVRVLWAPQTQFVSWRYLHCKVDYEYKISITPY